MLKSHLVLGCIGGLAVLCCGLPADSSSQLWAQADDPIAEMQRDAVEANSADWGYWGTDPQTYSTWTTHSNRLIPIYSFGISLDAFQGARSVYRDAERLERLYGYLPDGTHNPEAEYFDQTDVFRLQQQAVDEGKQRVILFVFDGMDWQTVQAAAIVASGEVGYTEGRGVGLAFQDYDRTTTDFGYFVTSPHNDGTRYDVDRQIVTVPGGNQQGGYDASLCGETPWDSIPDPQYPIGKSDQRSHAYTDSASSATSMTAGVKTYNGAINVDFSGREVIPIARRLQEQGFAVGAVSSVPVSHATPASAYANNVSRNDYQDLTRDLIGRPSVFHPGGLSGMDVVIGAGWGEERGSDSGQGDNFIPGNRYLADDDLAAIDVEQGGKYVVAQRTAGQPGSEVLHEAVQRAIKGGHRLFGLFGTTGGHLPYRTADNDYQPLPGIRGRAEEYSDGDILENVTLAQMTLAAARTLQARSDRWWLMVEAGDVDWANHDNNIDNSIGAVLSGDAAFGELAAWIEQNGGWEETAVIVTADHGHYLVLEKPEALAVQP